MIFARQMQLFLILMKYSVAAEHFQTSFCKKNEFSSRKFRPRSRLLFQHLFFFFPALLPFLFGVFGIVDDRLALTNHFELLARHFFDGGGRGFECLIFLLTLILLFFQSVEFGFGFLEFQLCIDSTMLLPD